MQTKKSTAKKPTIKKTTTTRKPASATKKPTASKKKTMSNATAKPRGQRAASTTPAKKATSATKKPASAAKKPVARPAYAPKKSASKPASAKKTTTTKSNPAKKTTTAPKKAATVRKPTVKQTTAKAEQISITTTPAGLVTVEIRRHRDSQGGHPHVMVDKVQGKEVSVGLTHSRKSGKNTPNRKLEVDPLGGKGTVYMQRRGTVAPSKEYGTPKQGKMTPKDYKTAKATGEKAKQKHLEKKK